MNWPGIMLADLSAFEVQTMRRPWGLGSLQYFMIIAGSLLGVALLVSAFFIVARRRRKRRHRHHHYDERTVAAVRPAPVQKRRRRRRRSGTQRPLNPTLAETGGLPPVRDANTPTPGL